MDDNENEQMEIHENDNLVKTGEKRGRKPIIVSDEIWSKIEFYRIMCENSYEKIKKFIKRDFGTSLSTYKVQQICQSIESKLITDNINKMSEY